MIPRPRQWFAKTPSADSRGSRSFNSYKQALWAATHAEQLHNAAQIPFHRPSDYFAEMLKTDAHMSTIRQNLLDEQAGIAASEAARKLREQKKFGKKVQVEKVRERQKEKREIGERLEGLKKSECQYTGERVHTTYRWLLADAPYFACVSLPLSMVQSARTAIRLPRRKTLTLLSRTPLPIDLPSGPRCLNQSAVAEEGEA